VELGRIGTVACPLRGKQYTSTPLKAVSTNFSITPSREHFDGKYANGVLFAPKMQRRRSTTLR
jgi:hypothetical protein